MNWPFWCVLGWVLWAVTFGFCVWTNNALKRTLTIYKELGVMFDKSIAREKFLANEIIKYAKKGAPNGRN